MLDMVFVHALGLILMYLALYMMAIHILGYRSSKEQIIQIRKNLLASPLSATSLGYL